MRRLGLLGLCLALVVTPPAVAQDDDRGRLTRFIESQLSDGADRQVRIDGFRGALSSEATLERLTISDADGAWLVLENARLNWRRAALLTGALQVQSLAAERLSILRPPLPPEGPDLPSPEATPFSLPDLPVSVAIDEIAIARLELGAPLLGQDAALSISGMARLADGSGAVDIAADRLDGPEGRFSADASFANDTRILGIDVVLQEAPGGLAATLLNLPGAPDIRLAIAGEGPLDDIEVALSLATEGTERVTGAVRSTRLEEDGAQRIDLDLSGDLTPLMAAEYRPFFGTDSILAAEILRAADGATELSGLRLTGAAFDLQGDISLDAQSRPRRFEVSARIANPDGESPVRLPVAGDAELGRAMLDLNFDAAAGDEYRLDALLSDLRVAETRVAAASATANGRITATETGIGAVTSQIAATLSGLAHVDPGVSVALGDTAVLGANLAWAAGDPLVVDTLSIRGAGLSADGRITAGLGGNEVPLDFELVADLENIARFSGLAGQELRGAVEGSVSGTAEALSGAFDVDLLARARDLSAGDVLPPEVLAGDSEIRIAAVRDDTGTRIDALSLRAAGVSADGRIALASGNGDLPLSFDVTADVQNIARFSTLAGQDLAGGLNASLSGTADVQTGAFDISLEGQARDLRIGDAVPPELLAGPTDLRLAARREGDDVTIDDLMVDGRQITVTAQGDLGAGGTDLRATARLADLGLFSPAVRGPASLTADISNAAEGWRVDAGLQGPAGLTADVAGQVGLPDGAVDLGAQGSVPLVLANRFIAPQSVTGLLTFDMTVRGAPSLQAVSGRLSTTDARLSVPAAQLALTEIALSANLQGGRVTLDGGGNVSTGGRVNLTGGVDIGAAGLPGDIGVTLDNVRLVDPTLYEVVIGRGDLTASGPLAGGMQVSGDITLAPSELRVPETGLGSAAPIPDIIHIGESAEERQTRAAAGLLARNGEAAEAGPAIGLDVSIDAPGRIFLRGRGIDAEFGGTIRIGGTTRNVIPAGRFELVRGRISILGTRVDFVEGAATLQGDFDPFLTLRAESRAGDYRIFIDVEGPASAPEISLSADPFLPEDEILAQLLFGRSVSALSPVQLLRLADAASSLAGGGSGGGLIAGLRDGIGLDDLDLQTDSEGNAAVRAGRYLSENIYTDVTIGTGGQSDLSLNIDLTPNITARGSVSSDGSSSLGVFFERDY